MQRRLGFAIALTLPVGLAACDDGYGDDGGDDVGDVAGDDDDDAAGDDDDDAAGDDDDDDDASAATFESDILPILMASCGCHGGAMPSAGFDLSPAEAFATLMGAHGPSGLAFVEPGSPEDSYLFHKLEGSMSEVGGSGARMPMGGELSGDDMSKVVEWIADGAPQ